MKLVGQILIGVLIGVTLGFLVVALGRATIATNKPTHTNVATHYVACPGFTQPLEVWGRPYAEGPYLRVQLSKSDEWRLIGPNCGIIPNPDNM